MSSYARNIPSSNNPLCLSDKLTVWCSKVFHLIKVLLIEMTLKISTDYIFTAKFFYISSIPF